MGGKTMKEFTGAFLLFLVTILMALFVADEAIAQDALEVAPEHYTVLLENDNVRVLEVKIKPGEKEAMHTHPATVHIELAPTKVKIGYPDGKSVTLEGHQGEAIWVGPVKHTIENVGDTEIHAYIVELKDQPYKE
jgi:quercetin dioxygenase-like cupin family protein